MSLPIHHLISGGPRPVAPFSHAVEADGWVFVTGQMPTDPLQPDAPLQQGVAAQTRRVMDNLKLVLAGLELGLENAVFIRVYLTEFQRDYAEMNAIYEGFFVPGKLPGRTCVGVTGLALGALVEIDMVARRP
jgi:2-iminobutanoate/2-iminopropanoate deaminase